MGGDERFLMQAEAQPVRKEADCRSHALIYLPFGNSTLIYHGEAARCAAAGTNERAYGPGQHCTTDASGWPGEATLTLDLALPGDERVARRAQIVECTLQIICHAPDGWDTVLQEQVRGTPIAIVG